MQLMALGELHEMGLHVAMDDFGTGYSSLSYLKRFPIDTIKIDRSFVSDIDTSEDDAQIIKTIINMGQTLNRRIVAEGVETKEQLAILQQYECDEIQGYFFCRPKPADELTQFFKTHQSTLAIPA
ncbi:MAG: EAL domain-containing protein [Rhodospirillaceae bacterium]|nr:EAL domain-containing protein [Rhodospirillaceae bacterium]